jgi:large subunit ribosomal protein L29
MKPSEIRALDDSQLDAELTKLHGEWRDRRFDEAVGKLNETARIREIKRSIARIHTIRTEREMDAALTLGVASGPSRGRGSR